jgi:molybdate transport system ATP-binding protein
MIARPNRAPQSLSVSLRHVGLRLGGRTVLKNLSWQIRPGERWVLLGANGAGKTQLLKILAGDVWPTPGAGVQRLYRWRGEVLGEPYGVKEEIAYIGAERQDRYEHYEWNHRVLAVVATGLHRTDIPLHPLGPAARESLLRLLRRLHIEELSSRRLLTLSYGQRRLVLLARALAWRPALLLLDEPFNGLDEQNRARALAILHGLRSRKLPWVLSTHRSEDIPASATHLAHLEGGRLVSSGPIRARDRKPSRAAAPVLGAPVRSPQRAEPLLLLRNAWVWLDQRAVLRRLNFQVAAGDCWVVHGANGSGKTSLLRAIHGDLGVGSQGELRRRGIAPGVPLSEFKRRVGYIAPELQSLHALHLPVADIVVSGLHASIGVDLRPSPSERRRALQALAKCGAAALQKRTARELSYGQLRRVLFARALVRAPDILLLDEPYAGLDAPTRAALRARVERANVKGATILIVSHHRHEWPAHASHELELKAGAVVYCGPLRGRRGGERS